MGGVEHKFNKFPLFLFLGKLGSGLATNEKCLGLQAYQAITVAQSHFAGVGLVLKVSGVVAVGRVGMAPC